MPPSAGTLATTALGTRAVELSARAMTRGYLRVLAYHGIGDERAFSAQMEHVVRRYTPVNLRQVVTAMEGGSPLPRHAVWVTFDDGHPDVVELAQPILDRLGIEGTMFVCPGLIDTREPYWWEIVDTAVHHGVRSEQLPASLDGPLTTSRLKTLPDTRRREIVEELASWLRRRQPDALVGEQLSEAQLQRWVESGHAVGNHSWDHPCLDRCEPDEQVRQVDRAHAWLEERWPSRVPAFAYPNGNWSPVVEGRLEELGYRISTLFDHRMVRRGTAPLRVSRVRVDATASLPRFRALVSGTHSGAFHLGGRIRRALPRPARI